MANPEQINRFLPVGPNWPLFPHFRMGVMLILTSILRVSLRPFPMFSHQSYHIRLSP
jgi:hypothetical protein